MREAGGGWRVARDEMREAGGGYVEAWWRGRGVGAVGPRDRSLTLPVRWCCTSYSTGIPNCLAMRSCCGVSFGGLLLGRLIDRLCCRAGCFGRSRCICGRACRRYGASVGATAAGVLATSVAWISASVFPVAASATPVGVPVRAFLGPCNEVPIPQTIHSTMTPPIIIALPRHPACDRCFRAFTARLCPTHEPARTLTRCEHQASGVNERSIAKPNRCANLNYGRLTITVGSAHNENPFARAAWLNPRSVTSRL